jgi:putative transcriptional regulator
MPQWKKPSKSEVLSNRVTLADRARRADLRLPNAVADIRKGFGLTQQEFADLLSLTRRQIAEIETGKANPTLETLEKIGRLFGFVVGFVPKAL